MRTFMNPHRTTSILQRLPVILAVTAASYGLPPQAQAPRSSKAARGARSGAAAAASHRLGVH
jgi:hypothetical protein